MKGVTREANELTIAEAARSFDGRISLRSYTSTLDCKRLLLAVVVVRESFKSLRTRGPSLLMVQRKSKCQWV